jgi:hypothetical protein
VTKKFGEPLLLQVEHFGPAGTLGSPQPHAPECDRLEEVGQEERVEQRGRNRRTSLATRSRSGVYRVCDKEHGGRESSTSRPFDSPDSSTPQTP